MITACHLLPVNGEIAASSGFALVWVSKNALNGSVPTGTVLAEELSPICIV